MKIKLLFIFQIFIVFLTNGQGILEKSQASFSSGFIVSTDSITPFLMRSNQYGLVPFKSNTAYLNANIHKEYDSLYTIDRKLKPFGYGYGLELHANLGTVNQMLLPVGYAKIRYKAFEIYAGRRREIQGLVDTLGTMGSYIWSGNALPMPKVEISIPNYTPILGHGLISIKGNYAHGWFGKGDSVQNVWLHQKSFYMRIGKPTWKVRMYGGFNHQVQWGGYPTVPFYDEVSKQIINKYGTDWPTYIKVVSGVSVNRNGDGLSQGGPANEAWNRAGNHLGSLDLGIDIKIKNALFMIYRQSIFDDGSLYYLNNIADGLNGISIKKQNGILRNICIEFLNTSNQGGDKIWRGKFNK